MGNLSLANAQGVPMMLLILWVLILAAVLGLAITFRGSIQV